MDLPAASCRDETEWIEKAPRHTGHEDVQIALIRQTDVLNEANIWPGVQS